MKHDIDTNSKHPSTFRFEPSISPPRFSTSFDYRNSSFDSRNSPADSRMSPYVENGSISSNSSRIHIVLSTPSPSTFANGERVDKEINRLDEISQTWRKHKTFEEPDFSVFGLEGESPQKVYTITKAVLVAPDSKLFRKRKTNSRSRSVSPENAPCPVHSSSRSLSRSRQSTPNRFSPKREEIFSRSILSPVAKIFPKQYQRSNSYDENQSNDRNRRSLSRSPSPLSNSYKRSQCYSENKKYQLFRPRSISPGLNPSIGSGKINPYYNSELNYTKAKSLSSSREKVSLYRNIFSRSNSQDDNLDTVSIKSSISLNKDLLKNENKYSTFPRRQAKKGRPNLEDNLFDNNTTNWENYSTRSSPNKEIRIKQYSSYSNPSTTFNNDKGFPQHNHSNRMSSSPRKHSDENSLSRHPLATLHEDGGVARGMNNDRREKSIDREFLDDYYNEQRKLSEAGVRKLSGIDASVVLTDDTDSFIIGDRVWVGGTKPGKISFIGETQFGPGDWAGITLDDQLGKNDGSVGGHRYFQCEPGKGVFSRLTRLTRVPLMSVMGTDLDFIAGTTPEYSSSIYSPGRRHSPSLESSRRVSPMPADIKKTPDKKSPSTVRSESYGRSRRGSSPLSTSTSEVRVGDAVVITSTSGTKHGTLRFIGKTEFADGLWGGVDLDEPTGKNDGSVAGKKYGLFAPMVRISKIGRMSPNRNSITPTRTCGKEANRSYPSYRDPIKYGTTPLNRVNKGRNTNAFDDDGLY